MTNLNDYIKNLSIKDRKTLSQKALKTCEEVGELAKAILPFDSAPGTNHRFIDRDKILEEIADVYLTNISIAYSLNFTDEEITEMIQKKAVKWQEIQAKEDNSSFPLPFEIHVSVDFDTLFTNIWSEKIQSKGVIRYPIEDRKSERKEWMSKILDKFKDDCSKIGVKPIVIDLEINNGSTIKDIMTSSKHFGDNRSAYEESERIARELSKCGYRVVRKKIETVPWHSAAPVVDGVIPIPNDCYFESHIGVVITPEQKENLNNFVDFLNDTFEHSESGGIAKMSQNFFKKSNDGSKFINMITYRNNLCGYDTFKEEVEMIKYSLVSNGFEFEKVEVEYAIYDTNVSHDNAWLKEEQVYEVQ
jgi:NTP pyrophosphatase (non-canonical NTP hydrolase)